jgi:hypothetical protein
MPEGESSDETVKAGVCLLRRDLTQVILGGRTRCDWARWARAKVAEPVHLFASRVAEKPSIRYVGPRNVDRAAKYRSV